MADMDRFERRRAALADINEDALYADGFEDAFLGYVGNGIAVYSRAKCIAILMERDGMSHDEAEEFFQFNTECAYVGEFTPLFLVEAEEE